MLLLSKTAAAAPTLVQQNSAFASAATATITLGAATTVGNLVVLFAAGFAAGPPTFGGTVTASGGWTQIAAAPSSGTLQLWHYAGIVTAAGTTVIETLSGSPYTYLIAAEFATKPASVTLDGTAQTSAGVSGQPTFAAYTTTNAHDLVIASSVIEGASDNGFPTGTGWLFIPVLVSQHSTVWQAPTTTGTFNATWPSTANTGWCAACCGLKVP